MCCELNLMWECCLEKVEKQKVGEGVQPQNAISVKPGTP